MSSNDNQAPAEFFDEKTLCAFPYDINEIHRIAARDRR